MERPEKAPAPSLKRWFYRRRPQKVITNGKSTQSKTRQLAGMASRKS